MNYKQSLKMISLVNDNAYEDIIFIYKDKVTSLCQILSGQQYANNFLTPRHLSIRYVIEIFISGALRRHRCQRSTCIKRMNESIFEGAYIHQSGIMI